MLRSHLNTALPGGAVLRSGLLAAALLADGEATASVPPGEVVRARWLMGTVLELRLPPATPGADALAEAAFEAVEAVERVASLWREGTELGSVHARAARGEAVLVSETLGALIAEALRASALTRGAFSPAVGVLVVAHGLRGEGRTPSEAELRRGAALADPVGVRYDPVPRELRLAPGVTLDLDGIAKGFALDRAAEALRARGVDDALLNFGGQLLAIGPPAGRPAREALVAAPGGSADPVLLVPLRDASLSTSGNSERVRSVAGTEAGHLLDPATGRLVAFSGSATVLAPTGALADALSTAWVVEGPAALSRSDPQGPLRRAGSVAFVLPRPDGTYEVVADPPFTRPRPHDTGADPAGPRP